MPLAVRGLVYEAGGRRLIDGVTLDLDGTGITMVMGPNGAGKSLLLRLLHGLIAPTHGSIAWGNHAAGAGSDIRSRQALVFQKPVLLRRSVAANIDFVLRLKGAVEAEERNTLLEKVGLEALALQPARQLSGGEQQRLALARALATEPDVLFLDEPTASLDPASALMIEQIVMYARAQGMRMLIVTHDIAQARRLADEVVFMHRGRVAEHTPADSFFSAPQSQAARDFLAGRIVI